GRHAEGLLHRGGRLVGTTGPCIRLGEPGEIHSVRYALPRREVEVDALAKRPDALLVASRLGERGAADDREQADEQRELLLRTERNEGVGVLERAVRLAEKHVEHGREESGPGERERIAQLA